MALTFTGCATVARVVGAGVARSAVSAIGAAGAPTVGAAGGLSSSAAVGGLLAGSALASRAKVGTGNAEIAFRDAAAVLSEAQNGRLASRVVRIETPEGRFLVDAQGRTAIVYDPLLRSLGYAEIRTGMADYFMAGRRVGYTIFDGDRLLHYRLDSSGRKFDVGYDVIRKDAVWHYDPANRFMSRTVFQSGPSSNELVAVLAGAAIAAAHRDEENERDSRHRRDERSDRSGRRSHDRSQWTRSWNPYPSGPRELLPGRIELQHPWVWLGEYSLRPVTLYASVHNEAVRIVDAMRRTWVHAGGPRVTVDFGRPLVFKGDLWRLEGRSSQAITFDVGYGLGATYIEN